jgi:hypothetical protein
LLCCISEQDRGGLRKDAAFSAASTNIQCCNIIINERKGFTFREQLLIALFIFVKPSKL